MKHNSITLRIHFAANYYFDGALICKEEDLEQKIIMDQRRSVDDLLLKVRNVSIQRLK